MMSFFAKQDRPTCRPTENEEEQEYEQENTELVEVEIPQPAEILDLLKSLTRGIEKLIAQQLTVQVPPANASQYSPEPGPSSDPRFAAHMSSAVSLTQTPTGLPAVHT